VAGVALVALGWVWWHAWARFGRPGCRATLRSRRGTWRHSPSFCVVGVALGDIHLRFAWQVWHLVTSTFVSRTWGTGLAHGALGLLARGAAPLCGAGVALGTSLCVAGVALGGCSFRVAGVALRALGWVWWRALVARAPHHFAWPAWHLATYGDIHLCFAWQVWYLLTSTFVSRGRCGTCGTGLGLVARFGCPGRRATLRGRRGT